MSIRATNWATAQVVAPLQKLVLLALAHRHHAKTGVCNPSVRTLASDTGLSERCVQYRLRELEAAGLIETRARRQGGAFTSSQYELQFTRRVSAQRGVVQETADGRDKAGGAPRAPNREETPFDVEGGLETTLRPSPEDEA